MRNAACSLSWTHDRVTDKCNRTAARLERFHWHSPVLLLFDEHGRVRAAAAAGRHLRALPRADGLAAGRLLGDAESADGAPLPGPGPQELQEGARQQEEVPAPAPSPPSSQSPPPPPPSSSPPPPSSSPHCQRGRPALEHFVLDGVDRVVINVGVHHLNGVRSERSCVAGRLGLPALAAGAGAARAARLEGVDSVDAVAAAVVAASPLAGAALSLLLEALLPLPMALLERARMTRPSLV